MSETPTAVEGAHKQSSLRPGRILFFDSRCLLCHRSIRWIIRHDPGKLIQFAGLHSQTASRLIPEKHPLRSSDTVILLEESKLYGQSEAVFRTLRHLRTAGKLLLIFSVLPRSWTDHVYRFVASRRYKWFGRDDSCPLPDPAQKDRFLS